jgi:two-component system phosphate regulon response regulator PhoB
VKTILLADDEANLRKLVRTTLEDPSCQILEAPNGSLALELARKERPDLLLLDCMMPGLAGIEVLKSLKNDPLTADIPVIMLSAQGQAKDREQALRLGARAYLVKPFSPLELLDKVQAVLDASKER